MPDPNPSQPESALAIEQEHSQLPEGFIPPAEFAQMPKAARQRLIKLSQENARATHDADTWRKIAEAKSSNGHAPVPVAAPASPAANSADKWGMASKTDETLRNLKMQGIVAQSRLHTEPDNDQLKSMVNDPGFAESMAAVDIELMQRAARSAAREEYAPFVQDAKLGKQANDMIGRLTSRFESRKNELFDPKSPFCVRATELRDAMLADRGVDATNPDNAVLITTLTELAYERADREMNRAGADGVRRGRLETEGPGSAARSMNTDLDEVSALIRQGRTQEAHAAAKAAFFKTGRIHPSLDAASRAG